MRGRRVLVIGGGIAGLAGARALSGLGMECEDVDRTPGWGQPGMGRLLFVVDLTSFWGPV